MELRRGRTHDIEHFGFDPVLSTTRTKDQTKENSSSVVSDKYNVQDNTYGLSPLINDIIQKFKQKSVVLDEDKTIVATIN